MAIDYIKIALLVLIPYVLFGIAYYANFKDKPGWFIRKLIHTFGLAIVGLLGSTLNTMIEVFWVLVLFAIPLVILSLIPKIQLFQNLIKMGTREGEREMISIINTTMTSISILTLLVISFDQRWFYFAGVLSVAIGDGLGEFIGKPYGKHKYRSLVGTKSFEGSIAVFIGTFVGIIISFVFFGKSITSQEFVIALGIASLLATVVEAYSVQFMDNVLMPWIVAGTLYYLI